MKAKLTVRLMSGREESFEIEISDGKSAEFRLKDFEKDPSLLLHTGDSLVLIPAHAIECLTLSAPAAWEVRT